MREGGFRVGRCVMEEARPTQRAPGEPPEIQEHGATCPARFLKPAGSLPLRLPPSCVSHRGLPLRTQIKQNPFPATESPVPRATQSGQEASSPRGEGKWKDSAFFLNFFIHPCEIYMPLQTRMPEIKK